ncbi:TetR family transcriptional regulator [Rhodobacter aestuarii]|uniref:HTH-type transcriptional regulator BetI n=1 Tax=Rhodobacter aestuarii TaxID=453582 RepID=A0A1N7J2I4_9RHOB|nr:MULTISPECIES: transcriptional regulator BetI [Rhodobacter]PTV97253.1 TetR family transcriptional regulator [Rhodobacter aestuarii]SIS43578.1 transcriptional regulator, TetR family [Rhodobacter aestuarii]SOB99396.1 TetR family transcriptional regulator [Rhodobacter sp. JA431]
MPKLGAEPIRRAALVKATIETVGEAGSLEVTVAQIARRAGMSSALAHHYFGSKEQIFLAAMRAILTLYGAEVRGALATADTPESRLRAIVAGSFAQGSFRRETISAWLNFYVLAQTNPQAHRLLRIYQRRLRSNLRHELRPLVGARAQAVARGLGAMIDGVYIRAALADDAPDRDYALDIVNEYIDRELEGTP